MTVKEKIPSPTWAVIVKPLVTKTNLVGHFGGTLSFSQEGCRQVSRLLRDMASQLDAAAVRERELREAMPKTFFYGVVCGVSAAVFMYLLLK